MSQTYGIEFRTAGPQEVHCIRRTAEAATEVHVTTQAREAAELDTGLHFFNHMLELVAWYGEINITARFRTERFRLTHVITEDVGLTLGYALARLLRERIPAGANCFGSRSMCIDEAVAAAVVSFEGRSGSFIERACEGATVERVEDMVSRDLLQFFNGFAQGAGCTIHLNLSGTEDPHHAWEAGFRAFGLALRDALAPNAWRKGVGYSVKQVEG